MKCPRRTGSERRNIKPQRAGVGEWVGGWVGILFVFSVVRAFEGVDD